MSPPVRRSPMTCLLVRSRLPAGGRKTSWTGPRSDTRRAPGRTDRMCGIVGYVGPKPLVPILMDGLKRLEYRGYDSAGVAVVQNGELELRRSAGKLSRLEDVLVHDPIG